MDDPDLYDDILGGTLGLQPVRVERVEALLEVGVHRRVLRLPANTRSPLQAVRDAATRLIGSDAGLRDTLGTQRLVFQRRSLKFDTWVDMEAAGERPVADGERLRVLSLDALEAGEVMTSEGDEVEEGETERRRHDEKKRRHHKKRRHRSDSRRHHRRHRSRSATPAGSEGDESVSKSERRRHRRRKHRRHRSRSVSSDDSASSRSRSRSSQRSSGSGSEDSSERRRHRKKKSSRSRRHRRRHGSSSRRSHSSSPVGVSPTGKVRVPPPRVVSEQAWQHMDPEFAEQLRLYELERARREGRQELCDHLADLAEVSDKSLSASDGEGAAKDAKTAGMSELGLRVLDRLKKLREELGGGGDQSRTSADKDSKRKGEDDDSDAPEPTKSKGGRLYAAYLNLDGKHPVMALHEYCTARQWEAPFFHLTEKATNNKKCPLFTAAVRVNKKMYTMPVPAENKKDGKRGAALYCLQKLGVLKGGDSRWTSGTVDEEEAWMADM